MEKYANIAGNPSQEALQEARLMINEGETILAVVKVSEETASRCRTNDLATTAPLAFTVMLPCVCLWPTTSTSRTAVRPLWESRAMPCNGL